MCNAFLLVLAALAMAVEPDSDGSITPPCAWHPVTCPDAGVPPRPLKWTRYGASVLEVTAFNVTWNLVTAYAFDLGWAQVSGGSISDNFEAGWGWDDDRFSTNFVAHPYHGAMLFNVGRMNGLTYWEALPLAAFGSWEWEQFLETDSPSLNDQLMTTIGGAYVGEALWRIAGALLDETARGGPRLGREIGAAVFDPARGLDRLLSGKAWRRGVPRVPVPTSGQIGLGAQVAWLPERVSGRFRLHGDTSTDRARSRTGGSTCATSASARCSSRPGGTGSTRSAPPKATRWWACRARASPRTSTGAGASAPRRSGTTATPGTTTTPTTPRPSSASSSTR